MLHCNVHQISLQAERDFAKAKPCTRRKQIMQGNCYFDKDEEFTLVVPLSDVIVSPWPPG